MDMYIWKINIYIRKWRDRIMQKEDIISKIKETAYENVNKKVEEERKRTEEKINKELTVVEEILGYINNKMLFIKPDYGEYVLVDEKMFFEDYSKEPENSWNKGLTINHDRKNKYDCFIKVNENRYYDIRYIIRNYEEDFECCRKRIDNLVTGIREIENKVENLKRQEPKIKKLLEQYKQVELNESIEGIEE